MSTHGAVSTMTASPFQPREAALGAHRHELLADKLLAPLAVDPGGQVDGAGRVFGSGLQFLVASRNDHASPLTWRQQACALPSSRRPPCWRKPAVENVSPEEPLIGLGEEAPLDRR